MWQSNRSRSTGWHRPAVPPLRSASQPGEKTSEQPFGMCGGSGCCGGPPCCSATTSLRHGRDLSMRAALRLIGVRCFMRLSPEPLRHRTAAGTRDSSPRSRRRSRDTCASSRESTRSSAGSGGRSSRSACAPRDSSRRRRSAAPSTSGSRSCSRCDASRGTPAASPTTTPSGTLPSLCSSEPAKRWQSATSPSVETPIKPMPAPHGYALA